MDVPSTAAPHLQGGTVRALAVTSPEPTPLAPGLRPANAVVPGFEAETWFGVYGPAGLPPAISAQYATAATEAIRDPALTARLRRARRRGARRGRRRARRHRARRAGEVDAAGAGAGHQTGGVSQVRNAIGTAAGSGRAA
jgi:hypothetical protein